jgi:hypothetical protein
VLWIIGEDKHCVQHWKCCSTAFMDDETNDQEWLCAFDIREYVCVCTTETLEWDVTRFSLLYVSIPIMMW